MQKLGLKRRISEITENDDDNDSNDQLTEPFGVDKRRSRNENEKKRRDKFNELIDDLATLLNRDHKIDKSTTLLETYNFFRSCSNIDEQQTKTETSTKWKPIFMKNEEFVKIMCDFHGSFFLVFGLNGVITYVSESITPLLGYMTKDVIEQSLFDFLDDKSSKALQSALKKNKYNISDNVTFQCNWKRSNVFESKYETVKINGIFKRCLINNVSNGYFITVASIETFLRINELYHNDVADREFTSDFSMDFKFINLDHRAIQIIGFSSTEIMGTSGYDYCHIDDIDELIECHKLLMKCGMSTSSVYRFRTKGHQWIFLQTHYTLKFSNSSRNESTDQAHSIHCTHHFINSSDVLMSKNSIMCTRNSIDSDNGIRMQLNDSAATNDDDLMTSNPSPPPPPPPPQPPASKIETAAAIKPSTNNNNYQKANSQPLVRPIIPSIEPTNKPPSAPQPPQIVQQTINDEILKANKPLSSTANIIDHQTQNNSNNNTILNNTNNGISTSISSISSGSSSSSGSSINSNSLQSSKLTVNNNLLLKLVLISHQQPAFREYVCKQFIQQKEKLEIEIRQKQERVNELNEMMKFFQDDKKLEQWAIEMKAQSSLSDNQQKAQIPSNMMNELTHESYNSHIPAIGLHHQSPTIALEQQQFYNSRALRQHPNPTLHHLAATASLNPTTIHPLASYFQNPSLLNRNPHEIMNHHHHSGEDEIDVEALDRLLSEYSLKQFDQFVSNFHRS